MMRFGVGLMALGVAMASPAWAASDKQDFEACDGRAHPGRQDDGMRGEPGKPSYMRGFPRLGSAVAPCTRALASPRLLPTQTVRRAHLLRARAAAHLKAGDTAKALADLDLAIAATPERSSDRFYQRSMGVSLNLLRALAHAQAGHSDLARPLALSAMAARPYSMQVQRLGADIVHSLGAGTASNSSAWSNAMRLEPTVASSVLMHESEAGNFAGVLALRPSVTLTWPSQPLQPFALLAQEGPGTQFLMAVLVTLQTAYARAATGDAAGARSDLLDVRTRAKAALPTASTALTTSLGDIGGALTGAIEAKAKQIEARIAVAEGRHSDAIALLVGAPMPKDAATVELLSALKASAPAKDAAMVPDASSFAADADKVRRERLAKLAPNALIAPETPRAVVDYDRARPNILAALVGGALSMGTSLLGGIDRTDGFRSTKNSDGTTKVEFIGNTPSVALVQEMTLLRAAELARAAGKRAFVIVDRKDFARSMRTTRNGIEVSSVATGYKSELTIRFVDGTDEAARALDAVAIIDSLGPLYYEEKGATA